MLLGIYHALPPFARSTVASIRGWQLRRWRYGSDLEERVAATLERDRWPADRWKNWQEERLAFVLHRAAKQVPYYRAHWEQRRRKGDRSPWERLQNWPVLDKQTLRESPAAFVADDCDIRKMFRDHTSGTTGKPLNLWWSKETVREWYSIMEARCRRWFGLGLHDRYAMIGGQLVTPFSQRRPPFWVWNAGLNQLYCSSYHLAPDLTPAYLDALARYGVRYLYGYPSSVAALAECALEQRKQLHMGGVILNAEPVYDFQREIIEKAFDCPVIETYGMAEIVAGASQCEHGTLHSWPEVGHVGFADGAYDSGSAAALECTGLMNADMPLIRYRVGDQGSPAEDLASCACGRGLPAMGRIHGRSDDVLYTADGRSIGRLDPVFKAKLPIREAQIVQESLQLVRVVFIPEAGYRDSDGAALSAKIRDRMGPVEIRLEPVTHIARAANGKFRAVVCRIPKEQLPTAMAARV